MDAALRAAGGADYDAGNAAAGVHAGGTATIKSASAAFFKQKDAETQLKGIQFDKAGSLAICPAPLATVPRATAGS